MPLDTNAELGLKVDKVAGSSLVPDEDIITLQNTSGINTGDQDLSGLVEKIDGHSLVPDTEIAKLAEYPELSGDPNKFVSDDGTVKEITSSIGVVGTDLYASIQPSTLLAGAYQLKQTIDPTETEMTIIAGGGAIVPGAKFIDEKPAQAFPVGTVGFDYWRKISSLAGEARKGLRFFLFDTTDNSETDIFAPLWSSPIEVTDFAERQISYSVPAINPTATQHYGVEFLFTATGSDKTLTYIVGDGRGWFMRLPLPLKHENLTDKNSEAAFQHVDERINEMPAEVGAASYTLLNRRQNLITGTLPNGVNSTLVIPALITGERNEVILHFKTNSVAAPTLVYSGFTPLWLNGSAISMKVNKQYTIVFEQINGIVKTSWGNTNMSYYAKRFFGQQGIVTDGLKLWLDASNPVSYPGSGTTWYDLSGNSDNATLYGPIVFEDNSLKFNGINNSTYVMTSLKSNFISSDFTFSIWVKRIGDSPSSIGSYIGNFSLGNKSGYVLANVNSDTSLSIWYGNGSAFPGYTISNLTTNKNWINITTSYTSGVERVYVNGIIVLTRNISIYQAQNSRIIIGKWAYDYSEYVLNGYVRESIVYNKGLSGSQVLQNFNATKSKYGL